MSEQVFEKKCKGPCGRILLLVQFPKRYDGHTRDGHAARCRECVKARHGARRGQPNFHVILTEKVCGKCKGDPQPIENFHRATSSRDGHVTTCKTCSNTEHAAYYRENRKTLIAKSAKWAKDNPERANAKAKEWRKANPERAREFSDNWKKRNPDYGKNDESRKRNNDARAKRRLEAIGVLGGKCAMCEVTNPDFLCFDHQDGGGAAQRKIVHQSSLPGWLKKHHYPKGGERCPECGEVHEGIRLLCFNHNMAEAIRRQAEVSGPLTRPQKTARDWRARMKADVIEAYGGRCNCCGETNPDFLCYRPS